MPCNIGYKTVTRAKISAPLPQEFKSKTEAPKVDAELLKKIGEEDPDFEEWLKKLEIKPILEKALERALSKIEKTDLVKFSISDNGYLEAKASFFGADKKMEIEKLTNLVFNQFQLEVLTAVLEILGYAVSVSQNTIEEKSVHKYVKIEKLPGENMTLKFEHFESPESLDKERDEFLALSQKLGLKVDIQEKQDSGKPIPEGTVHKDFLKDEKEKA
jgi:hypothetical protein